ncbi:MAG: hypothetical protein WC365_02210 [Candidatus Babeliales bacterium]|jgi:hypothetical protein
MFFQTIKVRLASLILLSFYALLHQPLLAAEPEQNVSVIPTVYEKIAQAHLPSLTKALLAEEKAQKEISAANRIQNNDEELFNLTPSIKEVTIGNVETYRLFCSMLQTHYAKEVVPHLTDAVLADLELLCGTSRALDRHVFGTLDNTITTLGKIELQKMLITPISDSKELQRRQKLIKQLAENPNLIKSLETSLQKIKQYEADLAWFWHQTDEFFEASLQRIYWEKTPLLDLAAFNKSTFILELDALFTTILGPWFTFFFSLLSLSGSVVNLISILHNDAPNAQVKMMRYFSATFLAFVAVFMFYLSNERSLCYAKNYHNLSNAIQKKMIGIARCMQALQDIKSNVFTQKESLALLASDKNILGSLSYKDDNEKRELCRRLSSGTFKDSPSLFSNKGRVFVTFKMMHEIKDRYIDVMRTVGTLDAYLSLAKLYRKSIDAQQNHYCFVDYVEQETPDIAINGLWHPLDSSLSGPQATTFAIIMAHTCGIAPAQEMRITPHATFLSNLLTEIVQQPAFQPSIAS